MYAVRATRTLMAPVIVTHEDGTDTVFPAPYRGVKIFKSMAAAKRGEEPLTFAADYMEREGGGHYNVPWSAPWNQTGPATEADCAARDAATLAAWRVGEGWANPPAAIEQYIACGEALGAPMPADIRAALIAFMEKLRPRIIWDGATTPEQRRRVRELDVAAALEALADVPTKGNRRAYSSIKQVQDGLRWDAWSIRNSIAGKPRGKHGHWPRACEMTERDSSAYRWCDMAEAAKWSWNSDGKTCTTPEFRALCTAVTAVLHSR